MLNRLKFHNRFSAIFGYITGYSVTKMYPIGRNIIVYQCYFVKFALSRNKLKMKIVSTPPPPTPPPTTPTTFSTVKWSGLRRRQKYLLRRPPLVPLQEGRDGEVRGQDQRQRRQQQERGQVPHVRRGSRSQTDSGDPKLVGGAIDLKGEGGIVS